MKAGSISIQDLINLGPSKMRSIQQNKWLMFMQQLAALPASKSNSNAEREYERKRNENLMSHRGCDYRIGLRL